MKLRVRYADGTEADFRPCDSIRADVLGSLTMAADAELYGLLRIRWAEAVERTAGRSVRQVKLGTSPWLSVFWRRRPGVAERARRVEQLTLLDVAASRRGGSFAKAKEYRRESPQAGRC